MAEVPRLSVGQLGAVREAFRRLNVGDDERRWRLSASAALLGLSRLDTTKDLDTVQAGKLVRLLSGFGTEADLASAVAAIRRERARFIAQLAAALACRGAAELPVPLPGQPDLDPRDVTGEVPGAPGHISGQLG